MSSPFFCLFLFGSLPLNYCGIFSYIHMGGQRHFPRNTLLYLFKHTLLYPLPAQVCTRDEGQTTKTFKQWAQSQTERMWVPVNLERWFSRFRHKLFLTVLKCPPHMILWTKRTFSWEMAEADCQAFGPRYTVDARKKCRCKLLQTKMTYHIFFIKAFVLYPAIVHRFCSCSQTSDVEDVLIRCTVNSVCRTHSVMTFIDWDQSTVILCEG